MEKTTLEQVGLFDLNCALWTLGSFRRLSGFVAKELRNSLSSSGKKQIGLIFIDLNTVKQILNTPFNSRD